MEWEPFWDQPLGEQLALLEPDSKTNIQDTMIQHRGRKRQRSVRFNCNMKNVQKMFMELPSQFNQTNHTEVDILIGGIIKTLLD
jgi:hypothetical protein